MKDKMINNNHVESHSQSSNGKIHIFKLFIVLSIYRLANAWMVRTQFDPDEYWQTLEPAYCLAFSNNTNNELHPQQKYGCALTWEWNRRKTSPPPSSSLAENNSSFFQNMTVSVHSTIDQALHGPVRSYVSILPTYWYYLACRSVFQWASPNNNNDDDDDDTRSEQLQLLIANTKQFVHNHSTYLISKGPAFLHAIIVAAPIDLSVWIIASRLERLMINSSKSSSTNHRFWWQSWASWALIFSVTSWFNGYALIRTYANSMEAMLLMVGVVLLGPELFDVSTSATMKRGQRWFHRHRQQARLAFMVGGLSACVRFTSLAAWIPMGLIITLREKTTSEKFGTIFGLCATNGILGVVLGCIVDRWIYGFWAIPFLGNFHFNAILGLGSLYGSHPLLWYIYAGIPAICGAILPLFFWDIIQLLLTSGTNDASTRSRLTIFWIIGSYTILHSFSEHKEFRFLLPVLPLMCLLAGHAIAELLKGRAKSLSKAVIIVVVCLLNYPHLIYLSTFHQRGAIATNELLAAIMRDKVQEDESNNYFSVHYLMGCHSAPVYSHLHSTNVLVNAWYLDCSPECRQDEDVVCESDAFANDPSNFMHSTYFPSIDGACEEEDNSHSCTSDDTKKAVPSFVVIMREDAVKVEGLLVDKWKATRVASIRNSIASISPHKQQMQHSKQFDVLSVLSLIDIHFEHMEIYTTI
jgi:phosphatidylinositol glycan class B